MGVVHKAEDPMTTHLNGTEGRGSQENFRARRRAFRALHEAGCFVIPNPWDVGSARYLQHLGFPALATTSAGFAFSQGLPDSEGALTCERNLAYIDDILHPEMVQQFVSVSAVSAKTTKNICITLQSMWTTARAWGYVAHDLMEGVVLPEVKRVQRLFLSQREIQLILPRLRSRTERGTD
jgi:hypothetical protein